MCRQPLKNSPGCDSHAGSELHGYTESSSLLGAKSPKASAGQGSALLGGSSGPPASHLLKEASGPVTESRRSFDWYRLGPGVQGI